MRHEGAAYRRRFEELTLPHAEAVYRMAYYLVGSQEAEDLTQETYLKAYQAFDQFRGPNAKPWLCAILRHAFLDRCRRQRHELKLVELEFGAPSGDRMEPCAPSAEEQVLDGQLDGDVQSALRALPDEWRLALLLAEVEDLTYREIAEVMHVPIGTVMSRLCRARRRLRDHLGEYARRVGYAAERVG
jgi:RNA polymerase sigma-70 factor (ECF subfamily)